jgi:anti-sigma factor RsiW
MTCREVADFMMDYANGELSTGVREIFEHHLRVCENCRAYLRLYLRTVEFGRRAFAHDDEAAIQAGVPEEMVSAILAARSVSK